MAHKKGAGSSDNGRDSKSKRLGVKLFGGQHAIAGNIIIRQRGTQFHAGDNVYMGRDHTLHAAVDGQVVFKRSFKDRRFVSIEPYLDIPVTPVKPSKKPTNPKHETEATPAPKPGKKAAKEVTSEAVAREDVESEVITASETVAKAPVAKKAAKEVAVEDVAMEETEVEAAAPDAAEAPVAKKAAKEVAVEDVAMEETEVEAAAPDAAKAPVAKKAAKEVAVEDVAEEEAAVEAEAAPEASAEKKAAAPKKEKGPKLDDLKIVEGVGPKIETLLKEGGISTWAELAAASEERLKEILDAAGPRYQIHDPSTWPAQAKFAVDGQWDELKEYQDMLTGGRDKSE